MTINLTPEQLSIISQKQAVVNATRLELKHAEEKLNLLITGIAIGKEVTGDFQYSISGTTLKIEFPEPTPIVEE